MKQIRFMRKDIRNQKEEPYGLTALRRLLIIIMAVLFVMSAAIPVRADETRPDGDDETIIIETLFDNSTTGQLDKWDCEYNDGWFDQSAEVYNHKLAQLSLAMAVSAFRPNLDPSSKENPAAHLQKFMTDCRFNSLRTDDYDKNPTLFTISTVMGYKKLQDDQGEYVLIAIGACGMGYSNEWMSNFSCGDDDMHLGFYSAASEVYDRLFGYIALNQLTGSRFKVWMSGFSRSAAVCNILAKLLVDSDVFDTSTVFAYTFATPRTTKNPEEGKYPNIYSICGKMDPVVQLPFGDWGYDRYGTTLYTPAQQTDSDYVIKAGWANVIHREAFGLDFFNNVEWDTRLRVILNYVMKIVPTSHIYRDHVQDIFIRILEDKTISNVMTCLMELAGDEELINDSNNSEANSLLTYLAYTAYGYITGSGIESRYRSENATAKGNLAREHTAEVYLAWVFSTDDPAQLYTDNSSYLRVVINGDVDVAIMSLGNDTLYKCLKSDGTFSDTFDFSVTRTVASDAPDIFMEREHGEHIILLPKDRTYSIVIHSNKDQQIAIHAIALTVGRTNGNFSKVYYADMAEGEYDVVLSTESNDMDTAGDSDIVAGDTFDTVSISQDMASELAVTLEMVNTLNLSWRQIILLAYSLPILAINLLGFLVSCLIGLHRLKVKKKLGILDENARFNYGPSAGIFLAVTMFMLQELLYWLMPSFLKWRAFLKLAIGLVMIALATSGWRRQPSVLSRDIVAGMMVFMSADLLINFSFTGGMLVYAIAEVLMAYSFIRHERPEKWQWTLWVFSSIVCVYIIMRSQVATGELKSQMAAYSVILMALVASSLVMPKKIRYGTMLLAVANVLLFISEVAHRTLIMHVTSLGMFYLAMAFYALSTRYREVKIRKPDSELSEQ